MLKFVGALLDSNERELKRLQSKVNRISSLEPQFTALSEEQLRAKTVEFKARFAAGESLEDILPEAFAAVREAARRSIGQRHYDVQLLGGMVLHQGKIAEMKTGEGKTLVATLPLYLNALAGQGAHLVTVNDYLAKRDPHWMGAIYHLLGLTVASIGHEASYIYDPAFESPDPRWQRLRPVTRREAYHADITYGTNNEFGFDYLRDNMSLDRSQMVQRDLAYAIVDEVDNILIDEARTPLIISGAAEESSEKYRTFARVVSQLKRDQDYEVDEKMGAASLTEEGTSHVERLLRHEGLLKSANLYDSSNYALTTYLDSALKAWSLYRRDKDYVVRDGQVIIVDEFTGRLMLGRRYSEGLHQAIEAREKVQVQRESITLGTITFQNYFRLYKKLAGMTGTALTEAEEFHKIYKLEVVAIPTNRPMVRIDNPDRVYATEDFKFKAVAREIEELHERQQPVLVGTTSVENSERLGELLRRRGILHEVLNAKLHEKEAQIVAQAGKLGAVTVATNMAGRGVDIILGGNPEGRERPEWQAEHDRVVQLGGLHVIGTERHESRRIDNQLRGRSGRQGDPGSSRFYVSLEDDIMRRFGGDRMKGLMKWAGMDADTPIEHGLLTKAIGNAQAAAEGHNFEIRKRLVDYDDVVNKHREVIYGERRKILSGADLKANIQSMVREEMHSLISADGLEEGEGLQHLAEEAGKLLGLPPEAHLPELAGLEAPDREQALIALAEKLYAEKEERVGALDMRVLERLVMLRVMDMLWVEHLTMMNQMRQGVGLQAVGQKDPLVVYKNEGHALFEGLLASIRHDVVETVYHAEISRQPAKPSPMAQAQAKAQKTPAAAPAAAAARKVGRNDPCPCGSGKKYKRCCGAAA